MSVGGFFNEERAKWVEAELARIVKERGGLTAHQKGLMRSHLKKEFVEVWATRDYVYGEEAKA